jgi:DNA-binding CsgD family transcriptional regulator/tetratricopeptide (TPR) repeat protein
MSSERSLKWIFSFVNNRRLTLATTRSLGVDLLTTFGRERELAILREAVAGTVRGAGGRTVLTGLPGIGKSHLLRAALDGAEGLGVAVAARAAFEFDRAAPFITLAAALQRIQPENSAFDWIAEAHDNQFRTLDRLTAALEGFVATQPLVIAIDDAQWTDEFSALAIRELMSTLASSPVRWLFARRPVHKSSPGQRLVERLIQEGTEEILLDRLDDGAVRDLCAQAAGAKVDNTVLALAAGCDGNPLQVEQLIRALRMTDQLRVYDGIATVVGDQIPSSFITIVEQMMSGLRMETRRMLGAGSVFDGLFTVDAVARLLGVQPNHLLPVIEEARLAKVLVDEGDGLAFVHNLVRLVVYSRLGGTERALYHREAAVIAREENRSPVEVAEHLLKGGRSTREAVTMLHEAALKVAGAAPSTAADLIMHALDVVGADESGRGELVADAVRLLASAGRLEQACELGEAALGAGLEACTEATLLLGLAEAFKHAGRNRTAVEYADRGLSYRDAPEAVRAKLWAVRAHALFYVGELAAADRSGSSAYESGMGASAYGAAVFGLTARGLVAQAEGRLDDALEHTTEATEIVDSARGKAAHRHPRIWLGDVYTALDRFEEADATFRRGRMESERLGTAWSTPLWHYYYAALLTASGRLDDAAAEAEAGVEIAETLTAFALAVPLLGALARLAVMRGDNDQAREHLERMRRWMADGITTAPEDATWAEAVFQETTAGPKAALRILTGMYDDMPRRPLLIVQDPTAAASLVHIAVGAGDRARAGLVVDAAQRLAERNPTVHSLAAAAAHADGVLRGDGRLLQKAIEAFRLTGRPLGLASALEDAIHVGVDSTLARSMAAEAVEITTKCGAERARLRLSSRLGGTRRANGFSPTSRLAALTPAEVKVALLVGDGYRNLQIAKKLFLSRHTVDTHLRKIFAKVGINSRVDLAALVAREREAMQ